MSNKKDHPSGVDRWTSNGKGLTFGKISKARRDAAKKAVEQNKKKGK